MPARRSLDINKLKIVDSADVPTGRIKFTKWQEIFSRIPAGKALVVTEDEVSFVAVRSSLYELQKKGQFKQLRARKVKEPDGTYKMYVVNEAQEEIGQKSSVRLVKRQELKPIE